MTFKQGTTATLTAEFFDVPGGSAVNVTGLTITITPLGGGTALGPTSIGIVHAGLGVYTYDWVIPPAQPTGDYLVAWNSNEANASEVVEVTTLLTSTPSAGPCGVWNPIWCEPLPVSTVSVSGWALQAATEVLWAKSGRQFDTCEITLRPCRDDCFGGTWPWGETWNQWGTTWPYPYNYAGQWFNLGCGGCPGQCSCTVLHTVELPAPVGEITEVRVDGVALPTTAYRVYDHRTLVRTDGQPWPLCNDLNKSDTEVGTWSVTFVAGTAVPALGRLAVGELARELALACVGEACRLPSPVQQIVRQGVSLTFLDPNEMFADGKTGLYRSDLFISTFNPGGVAARAVAVDVDGPAPRRQTWP